MLHASSSRQVLSGLCVTAVGGLSAVLGLVGCESVRVHPKLLTGGGQAEVSPKLVTPEKLAQLHAGQSTRADVLRTLGLPHERELEVLASGGTREYWYYAKGRGKVQTMIGGQGGLIPISQTQSEVVTVCATWHRPRPGEAARAVGVIITFNQQGIVEELAY